MRSCDTIDSAAERRILDLLASVPDPEIPAVSITELGIVRGVRRTPPAVLLTPTYTGCPATLAITTAARVALDGAGFEAVAVETVLDPPWTTDWISDQGREKLKAYGIAPPPRGDGQGRFRTAEPVSCPRCASQNTREVSRFGSTPCKALWVCQDCREPFDQFKCH
jgi:ring-1,2-phenylacetyl-CoA epoxidase subunit PaaD